MRDQRHVCILGLGNEYRRDDGVGIWVAREMAAANGPGVTVSALEGGDATAVLAAWEGAQTVYLVDAVRAEAAPGTIVRLGPRHLATTVRPAFLSSHGLGLEEAVALGRALGILPKRVVIYGIVGREFGPGQGLSPEVERAAREVVRRLKRGGLAALARRPKGRAKGRRR